MSHGRGAEREPAHEDLYGRARERDRQGGYRRAEQEGRDGYRRAEQRGRDGYRRAEQEGWESFRRPEQAYREPDDGYRQPADVYRRAWPPPPADRQRHRAGQETVQPAGPVRRDRRAGRGFAGRGLAEVAGAVALVVVSAAVTWVVASHHYARASSGGPAPAQETAAAALAAADGYFALYGAGQYAAVYPLIAPADRAVIPASVWTGLHKACPVSGLTYQVKTPVLSGATAVMAVGYSGAAGSLGSEQVTFTYAGGQWYYVPSDLTIYRGHTLAQAVAAAKADNLC
jgi:hypothetical protein